MTVRGWLLVTSVLSKRTRVSAASNSATLVAPCIFIVSTEKDHAIVSGPDAGAYDRRSLLFEFERVTLAYSTVESNTIVASDDSKRGALLATKVAAPPTPTRIGTLAHDLSLDDVQSALWYWPKGQLDLVLQLEHASAPAALQWVPGVQVTHEAWPVWAFAVPAAQS